MIALKTAEEVEVLREAGKRLARVLAALTEKVAPGVSTAELDMLAEEMIRRGGDIPAFKGYTPEGASRPYPSTLCASVNDEIVHGIPSENPHILEEGDIIGLDCGLRHEGLIVDAAVTVPVGVIDPEAEKLILVTREALAAGIAAAEPGGRVGDISAAIEAYIRPFGYGIVRELGGHGVGYKVHEEPHIPNFGKKRTGPELLPGAVLALEPMVNEGTEKIILADDGYTFKTADGKRSAHFEHTIVITEDGPEILTRI